MTTQSTAVIRNTYEKDLAQYWDDKQDDDVNLLLGEKDGLYHHHYGVGDYDHRILEAPADQRVRWTGLPFGAVYEQLLRPRVDPDGRARFVRTTGVDGYVDTSELDDLLAENVLLARALDGGALSLDHGAPLRLVAPDHYGYKNVKHVVRIELRCRPGFRWPLSLHHPRARVAFEERFHRLPGRYVGSIYRHIALAPTLWWFRRTGRR